MVKLIIMLKRKNGLTHEEFVEYWENKHGPLAAKMFTKAKRYVQNHPVMLPGGKEPPIDGIAEMWFDDVESQQASATWYQTDDGKPIRDDEAKFMDRSKMAFFLAEEKEIPLPERK